MGAALSSFRRRWWRRLFSCPPDLRVMMLGLDAAGKTTIWYRLKMDEAGTNSPTIGFGVETVQYKDFNFTVWDMGGRDKIRPLWRHYYQNTSALIWVVDSNDSDRLDGDIDQRGDSSRQELHRTLAEDELRGVPLLVFANKQDLPNARSTSEITQRLGLEKLRGREWLVQGCSADSGDGLLEGLEWLSQAVKRVGTVRHPSSVPAAALGPTMDAIASHNPNLLAATALGSSAEPDASVHGASAVTPVPPSKPEPLAQESPSAAGETADTGTQSLSHAESVSSGAETFAASTQVDEFEPDFVLVERVQQT